MSMLVDTSGWLCYFDASDFRNAAAVEFYHTTPSKLTHAFILAEYVALAHVRGMPRQATLQFVANILDNPVVEMMWVTEECYRNALALLQARSDKTYSLCDAISFILMKERGITAALTTDRHFEQEGFRKLL
jgi:predicted nucleic acid-binding protein